MLPLTSLPVDLSLALIDLGQIGNLSKSVGELFADVKKEINAQSFSEYSRMMTRKKVYGYTGRDSESYDLVDLLDLCGSLKDTHTESFIKVNDGINKAVLYARGNIDNSNGLSVYFVNYNKIKDYSICIAQAKKDINYNRK